MPFFSGFRNGQSFQSQGFKVKEVTVKRRRTQNEKEETRSRQKLQDVKETASQISGVSGSAEKEKRPRSRLSTPLRRTHSSSPAVPEVNLRADSDEENEAQAELARSQTSSQPGNEADIRRDLSRSEPLDIEFTFTEAVSLVPNGLGATDTSLIDEDISLSYPANTRREKYFASFPDRKSGSWIIEDLHEAVNVIETYYLSLGSRLDNGIHEDSESCEKLKRAYRRGDLARYKAILDDLNAQLDSFRAKTNIKDCLANWPGLPRPVLLFIVGQAYARTVGPKVDNLKKYQAFSNNVYGEMMPSFLTQIMKECKLQPGHTFVDLGSGVGNCVIQAALEIGCASYGCEIMSEAASLAESQLEEFDGRCKYLLSATEKADHRRLWGVNHGPVTLIKADFLQDRQILDALNRSDVVLVNNYAFNAELQGKILDLFLDLPEGCKVVTLKPLVPPGQAISERNFENPANMFAVEQREYFSGSVSWTNVGGPYYVHTVDRARVQRWKAEHQHSP